MSAFDDAKNKAGDYKEKAEGLKKQGEEYKDKFSGGEQGEGEKGTSKLSQAGEKLKEGLTGDKKPER